MVNQKENTANRQAINRSISLNLVALYPLRDFTTLLTMEHMDNLILIPIMNIKIIIRS